MYLERCDVAPLDQITVCSRMFAAGFVGGCYDGAQDDDTNSGGMTVGEETDGSSASGSGADGPGSDGGDGPVPVDECAEIGDAPDLVARRLTNFEYANTVEDVLGVDIRDDAMATLPDDLRVDGFSNTVGAQVVTFGHVEAYHDLAGQIVERVPSAAALANDVAGCAEFGSACEEALIRGLGARLWRRPLSDDELVSFAPLFRAAAEEGEGFEEGVGLVLRAMLAAPQFLYRLEDETSSGGPTRALDGYEMASRLSYLVWGSAPDQALYDAAESNALLETAEIEAQIERMLQTPRAREASLQYISDWLALDGLPTINRDPSLFPGFSSALASDMREETRRLFEHVVWEEEASLLAILDADYTFASPELAAFYGLEPQADWALYDLGDAESRLGILTHAGVLALNGHGNRPSVVERGLFVLRSVLCGDVIAPPAEIDTSMADLPGDASQREKSQARLDNGACVSCHGQFDTMGWGFERYDGVGADREVDDDGNALGADGFFVSPTSNGQIPYQNIQELVSLVADDETVSTCVGVRQPLQYSIGRPLSEGDRCAVEDVAAAAAESGGTYQSLVKSIAVHPSFRRIRVE